MALATKRALDLVIAAPVLVLASPVLLVAALLVRWTSPGPAIFSQVRIGIHGLPFRCHKLRTMRQGTPSLPTHEAPTSSITPVGRTLRRFKLDELPQLWNVLRGEMSLVGPRPCLPSQTALIDHRMKLGVYSLLPGITGLAQTEGIDMSDPVLCAETDAAYLRMASTRLDLRIMLRTLYRG